jgi:transposase-like protein
MTTIESPIEARPTPRLRRRRFTTRDRKRLIRLYERSGQSAQHFCRENDLSPSSLWRWLARERRNGQQASGAGELVEIAMAPLRGPEPGVAAVTMQIAGGARLEVAAGTDPAWIGALVRALTPASE